MAAKNKLGKGFDALVPVGVDVYNVTAQPHERVYKLAVDIVKPRADQPRKNFDEIALEQLTQSVREHGIMQPIIVVESEPNIYSIIAGERRWRAAQLAGLNTIPAIVRSATEHEQLELALIENVQREDLSPIETAKSVVRLHDQFNQSYEDIAKRLGKAYTTVINIVRLLSLPDDMQQALNNKLLSEGHARALLSLAKLPKQQKVLYEQIKNHGWSVRQSESFAAAAKKAASEKKPQIKKATKVKDDVSKQLNSYLKSPVTIQHTAKGGRVIIKFTGNDDLTRIVELIKN